MFAAAIVAGVVFLSACGAMPFPEAPSEVGEDYPDSGIPTSVMWPSDWLEGFVAEPNSPAGPIVGLRLEYVDDRWVWRVRSLDPGRDVFGESVTEPDRGQEAIYDATTLARMQERKVTLTRAELSELGTTALEAAQLSGEVYPTPRLIELERVIEAGEPAWRITTYDTETGEQTEVTKGAD